MTETPRIVADPKVLVGKPIVRGTRISVEFVLGSLAEGWTREEILDDHPGLADEDITACLNHAREVLSSERVFAAE